jgi:hypothetical protein
MFPDTAGVVVAGAAVVAVVAGAAVVALEPLALELPHPAMTIPNAVSGTTNRRDGRFMKRHPSQILTYTRSATQ